MNDVTIVSSSQRTSVTHKSKHMMTWLLKNEFISETHSRTSDLSDSQSNLNRSDISLRKRILENRLQKLVCRQHRMQRKDLELSFRRENLRRRANELNNDVDSSPMKKPRMGISSFSPVKKHLLKTTTTTQTSSSLLTRLSTSAELLCYTRKGVKCTWC